jgi:putative acetyltransferase
MSLQKFVVREYRAEDTQFLASIYYQTIHKVNIQHYTEEQVDAWAPEVTLEGSHWAKKFETSKPFVAMADDMIVGFAEFEPNGHIDCFYCHHLWIGHGVGSALMEAIHQKAGHNGNQRLFAEVSITARPFFEKQGFKVVVEQTIVRKGVQLTNFKMEKHLIE